MRRFATVLSVGLLTTLAGCVDPVPNESYFDHLVNYQRTLSDGVISFTPSPSWQRWDAQSRSNILGYRMLAKQGRCDGLLRIGTKIPYAIARTTSGYVVTFGLPPGVVCRIPLGQETATLRLHPSYSPLPLFDPDEPVGDADISILLMPKVH